MGQQKHCLVALPTCNSSHTLTLAARNAVEHYEFRDEGQVESNFLISAAE